MSKQKELIGKLEKISDLYKTTVAIRLEMDEFVPDDHYKREITVPVFPGEYQTEKERMIWTEELNHTSAEAPEIAKQVHRQLYGPKEPEKPKLKDFEKPEDRELRNKQSKFNGLSKLFAGIAIFFFLGTLLNLNDEYSVLPTLIIITVLAAAAFLFFGYMVKKLKAEEAKKEAEALAAYNRQKEKIMAEYAKQMQVYEGACAEYEDTLKNFMNSYLAWREIFIRKVKEEAQIAKKLEADRSTAVAKIYEERYLPAEAELNACNDLVAEAYLPNLKVIIDLLKSKRADDLKEAINLYEEMVYRERQLQLQREQEEQRRYEEEQRRQDEERRHREEMNFRESQERQRRYEEERRRQDEERRHREETRAREAEARSRELQERERIRKEQYKAHMDQVEQQNKQRSAGQAQCRACAHVGRCNMSVHNHAPTCTGFTPRR